MDMLSNSSDAAVGNMYIHQISTRRLICTTALKIMWSLTWNTSFGSRFRLILDNLQRHQILVDNEAHAEDIVKSHIARQEALDRFLEIQTRERKKRKVALFNLLEPANTSTEEDKYQKAISKNPNAGNWLLETKEMKAWIDGKGKFIWLTGRPGAGERLSVTPLLVYWRGIIHACIRPTY